jgi:hypothetical protein
MSIGSTSVLAFTPRPAPSKRRAAACVRVGLAAAIACAPVTAALAQGTQSPSAGKQSAATQAGANQARQIDGQRQFTPGRLVVPVTGTVGTAVADAAQESAAGTAAGSFAIQRFARTTEDAVAAVGTLSLTFTDQETDTTRTVVTQAAMPLARSTDVATPTGAGEPSTTRACETLRLVLGSIEIAPLGVAVQIDRVNVDVTALPGVGERLSALLCDVTSQLTGTARPAELVNTLNALLDVIG